MELGNRARDKITGFEGIITGRAEYLTGCTQFALAPAALPDGSIRATEWFDEGRIQVIDQGISQDSVQAPKNGGPQREAPRG